MRLSKCCNTDCIINHIPTHKSCNSCRIIYSLDYNVARAGTIELCRRHAASICAIMRIMFRRFSFRLTSRMTDVDSEDSIAVSANGNDIRREFVLLLLSLYKDSPELWNTKLLAYKDRNKRSIALNKITKKLRMYDKTFTVSKLKRKINTLRSNFNREYNKYKRSVLSATNEDILYQPTLWYYNEMLFITEDNDPISMKSEQTEDSFHSIQETEVSIFVMSIFYYCNGKNVIVHFAFDCEQDALESKPI